MAPTDDSPPENPPGDGHPSPEGPHDEALPALTLEQAAALRRMLRDRLAEQGQEGTLSDDGTALTLADGTELGLTNLSAAVAGAPWERWPELVEHHLQGLTAAREADLATPDLSGVLLRLRPLAHLAGPPRYPAPEVLPGVLAVFASDLPSHVAEHLGELPGDEPFDVLWERAMTNLAGLPTLSTESLLPDPEDETSRLHVLDGPDFFAASRLLLLPRVLDQVGLQVGEAGLLVAIPNRHLLLLHAATGPGLLAALTTMAKVAVGESERPGAISQHVYHLGPQLLDGPVQQVTQLEADAVSVEATGQFGDALGNLGLSLED